MTKTAEQREKDLKEGVTWVVATAWSNAISGVKKDIGAKIFLKSGNVEALADRYDKLQSEFNKNREKKTAAVDLFDAARTQMEKIDKEIEGLSKEITDIAKDESASVPKDQKSDEPQARITAWENGLRSNQDQDKAQKAVFDRWEKLNALEGEMRKVVGLYQNTATEMDRQDIASAVRSFLAIFAKA